MLSAALLLATVMVGVQPDESIDSNLKPLARLVGSWNATFDWPGIPFKEAKVTYRWILNGRYLEARWTTGDGIELGPEFFAWDPVQKAVRMWGFDQESFYEATWRSDGQKWIGTYSGTQFSGAKTKDTICIEFKDASTVLLTQTPEGAEKPGGTAKFVRANSGN